jgi:alkaline phosphatase D
MQIGDFDHRDPGNRPPVVTIDNWRTMHRDMLGDYASGRDLAVHIAPFFPIYHIWDDHDYGGNNEDRTAEWKPLATQAFREYFPLPPLPNPDGGLWYSFRYAQAEFFMLDLRSQRDPDDLLDGPDKSMLDGGRISNGQKQWLEAGLLASTARWKFIVSSSAWNPHSKQVDSWVLYQFEQQELVNFIQSNNITGVIIISGDLHTGGAIDNGTNSYFPEISVPTTNVHQQLDCTGDYCGTWSEGIFVGADPAGYALITVQHDPGSGADTVILRAKAEDGSLRLEYSVTLPPVAPLNRR